MSESAHPLDGAGAPEPRLPGAAANDRVLVSELRDEVERLRRRLDDLPTRLAQMQR